MHMIQHKFANDSKHMYRAWLMKLWLFRAYFKFKKNRLSRKISRKYVSRNSAKKIRLAENWAAFFKSQPNFAKKIRLRGLVTAEVTAYVFVNSQYRLQRLGRDFDKKLVFERVHSKEVDRRISWKSWTKCGEKGAVHKATGHYHATTGFLSERSTSKKITIFSYV